MDEQTPRAAVARITVTRTEDEQFPVMLRLSLLPELPSGEQPAEPAQTPEMFLTRKLATSLLLTLGKALGLQPDPEAPTTH